MALDLSNPLDRIYLETVPSRPTPPPAGCNLRGPTAELMRMEAERELWALAAELDGEEVA